MKHASLSKLIPARLKKRAQPSFVPPMLATLTSNYFSSTAWIYEQKFDGERCLAFKQHGKVTLKSRNKKIINKEYPELVAALTKESADNFIIDGEIVSLGKAGVSDFQLLQGRINLRSEQDVAQKEKELPILYRVFDLMYIDGYDVRSLPLITRKKLLKQLLSFRGIVKYSIHWPTHGLTLFKKACKMHWEGLIAKRAASTYQGKRSPDWLKFKCSMEQELIIIGYTSPQGSRTDFGALLVGYYDHKKLMYAGKVGSGYSHGTLKMLGPRLRKLAIDHCPATNYEGPTKGVHWVKPQLVAEFKFAQWTKGSRLRVPRYKGMRDDKAAKDVVKEVPKKIR